MPPPCFPSLASLQLPENFFWELQYRPLIPSQPLPAWQLLEVATGGLEAEVGDLDPGTKYAFR